MSEELSKKNDDFDLDNVTKVSGMYKDWFLDYASYVILERAVPSIEDGLKPVQRRIFHSMKELDDGRYSKVANLVGNTMKYHPHGDMSITDAMIQLGQKELMIDTQGNWGNIFTGDRAAASRYIEARLSEFGGEVAFNKKTTSWTSSYDGRNKEPLFLPIKFPLLLAQGVEGIAVGLSTKILPHNFIEIIDASIKNLQGKDFELFPDFITGGAIDISNYKNGQRSGKVRVRAKIKVVDTKTLAITEIPFGTNTSDLIESIIKANDKGKIKIQKVEDNTAENVEILVHLQTNVSAEKTITALFAFTDCEISISTICCVIKDDKPLFTDIKELLKYSTENTVFLLKQELEIKLKELEEEWHLSSLEKIFIENKIYRDFEEKSYEEALLITKNKLNIYTENLIREITDEDIKKLLEIKMRRITKHDSDKADLLLLELEKDIKETNNNLDNIIEYTINYFKNLKNKYKKGKERRTEIKEFTDVDVSQLTEKNTKLYIDREEGFIGTSLKKAEFLFDCSDMDDIITFTKEGKYIISKISEKTFIGKDIIHVDIFNKNNERLVYNVIYLDGKSNFSYMKRFNISGIIRDKKYDLTQGNPKSKILYFSANKNAEAEILNIKLKAGQGIRKLDIEVDFSSLPIKGKSILGNLVTKLKIDKITLKKEGKSTFSNPKIWFDTNTKLLNTEEKGTLIGEFSPNDKILLIYKNGIAKTIEPNLNMIIENDILYIEKWDIQKIFIISYYDTEKSNYFIKKFRIDKEINDRIIPDKENNFINNILDENSAIKIKYSKSSLQDEIIHIDNLEEKSYKSLGKIISKEKIKTISILKKV